MADITTKDVQVMARVLGFTEKPPSGDVSIGIVFSATNPQSAKDAEDTRKILGDGLKAGRATLKPVLVKVEEVAGATGLEAFFLTAGVGGDATKFAVVAKGKKLLCVTTDVAQVQNGACTVGVRSEPKVEIMVNRSAATDSGTVFAAAFRMMITEF